VIPVNERIPTSVCFSCDLSVYLRAIVVKGKDNCYIVKIVY